MVRAVVLVRAPMTLISGQVRQVAGVKDSFDVRGRFDSVAYVSVDDLPALKKTVLKIQSVKGVSKTETLVEL